MQTHAAIALLLLSAALAAGAEERAAVTFSAVDAATGNALPCRMHVADAQGRAVRADGLPFFANHFDCEGKVVLALAPGTYSYAIERGPEWSRQSGEVEVAAGAARQIDAKLARIVDLAAEGWWSGDLHVHRPPSDMPLILRAEDLHIAPVITWWNARNAWETSPLPADPLVAADPGRFYHLMGGEDERQGGAFMYFNTARPIDITKAEKEFPCPIAFLEKARAAAGTAAWIDIEKPFWWDVPVAIAHGFGDSIGIANNHLWRQGVLDNEAWGKPRDRAQYPPPRGNGLWSQQIYYHLLNCGLRVPPSAGSASGVLPNPVGYNRVYVHLDGGLSYAKWWEGLRAGRSFVTNGPLLRVRVDGQLPGHVFKAAAGQASFDFDIQASIAGNDRIESVEVIVNGVPARTIRPSGKSHEGPLCRLRCDRSGWLVVRAIAEVDHTLRFASTAPYYVEIGETPVVIRRQSARFFLDWVNERAALIAIDDAAKRAEVMKYHDAARRFWEERLAKANAD